MGWLIWLLLGVACVSFLLGFVIHALMASSSIQELLQENSDLKSMIRRLVKHEATFVPREILEVAADNAIKASFGDK